MTGGGITLRWCMSEFKSCRVYDNSPLYYCAIHYGASVFFGAILVLCTAHYHAWYNFQLPITSVLELL